MNEQKEPTHKKTIEDIKVWLFLGYPSDILRYPSDIHGYLSIY